MVRRIASWRRCDCVKLDSLQELAYREMSCWGPGSDSVDLSPPQRLPADSEIR
jgi:hypothetical protein